MTAAQTRWRYLTPAEEHDRAEQERERAREAHQRAEQEHERANVAHERAEQERERADQEAKGRIEAEDRVRLAEEELARMRAEILSLRGSS